MANHNFLFRDVNHALPVLLSELGQWGAEVGSRAGRTKELTHVGITLREPWNRENLLGVRKTNLAAQIAETMWVLSGRNDTGWLINYLPRAAEFSDDGKTWRAGYGPRMRSWGGDSWGVDQLAYVVDTLRANPLSRQAVISLWDPPVDTTPGKDIPCNDWLSFSSRLGKLDVHVAVRSNDLMWGWSGINVFEWSSLLEIVAGLLGLEMGSLHFATTSLHLYDRHWGKAQRIVDLQRDNVMRSESVGRSPRFQMPAGVNALSEFDKLVERWFEVEKMIRNGDHAAAANVTGFPEPMLRSWLQVLQWWWTADDRYLEPLKDTNLGRSARLAVQPTTRAEKDQRDRVLTVPKTKAFREGLAAATGYSAGGVLEPVEDSAFLAAAVALHNEKHAAYSDSWKRRGEMLGIMANIARKVDRLGGAETKDETSADTAMDLMIYLAKYRDWLDYPENETTVSANSWLRKTEQRVAKDGGQPVASREREEEWLRNTFDQLEVRVTEKVGRSGLVEDMLAVAYVLAKHRWQQAQDADEYRGADADAASEQQPREAKHHRCVHTTSGRGHGCWCETEIDHAKRAGCRYVIGAV